MSDRTAVTRRTALRTAGAVALGCAGTATAGARENSPQDTTLQTTANPQQETVYRSGVYSGTVDRIVDGEHVVILLEDGGRAIDQVVVNIDRIPDATEGESATVWLWRGRVLMIWTN